MAGTDDAEEGSGSSFTTVVSGGVLVSAGRMVGLGFGFLTQIVMARLLADGTYGEVVLVLSVANAAAIIAQLGLDDGVMRLFPRFEDEPGKARGVVRVSLGLAAVSGSAAGAGVYAFAPVLATAVFENASLVSLFRTAAIGVPFVTVGTVSVALARGARDARLRAFVEDFAKEALRFGLTAAFLAAGVGAAGAVAGHAGAYVLTGLIAVVLTLRILPTFDQPAASMSRTVLAFSLPLIAVQALNTFVSDVDIYVLGYFWSTTSVGDYNIALQLSNLFFPILYSFSFLLPPVLTRLHDRGETAEMRRTYQEITKWVVVLGTPLLVVLLFAPRLVVTTLFGAEYVEGIPALRILAVGNFVAIATGLTTASLIGLGENRLVAYLMFYQTAVNALLDFVLIPGYVTVGAALATSFAVVTSNLIGVAILYRKFGVHPVRRATVMSVAVVGALAAAALGVVTIAELPLVAVAVVVVACYPVVVLRVAVEPGDERLLAMVEDRTNADLTLVRRMVRAVQS